MSEPIRITDVAPRDGLQNEPKPIPTSEKIKLIRSLCEASVDEVEVSSFVSAKWIPQLGDAAEVFAALAADPKLLERRPVFSALVPNEKGMLAAAEVNHNAAERILDKVSVFTAASETFSQRNTNASIDETIKRFAPVIAAASRDRLLVRAYISCIIACPFEGPIAPAKVADVIRRLAALQDHGPIHEIDLGDTIGAAAPETIRAVLEAAGEEMNRSLPSAVTTLHLHDTFGRAGACVETALDLGIRSFDSAAGGLGGCPYASTPGKRAPGNIATSLLVEIARKRGFETGIEPRKLAIAGSLAQSLRTAI